MDPQLLAILVCPLCKGKLTLVHHELICRFDRLAYPIREGIPVMLEEEARVLTPEALSELPVNTSTREG